MTTVINTLKDITNGFYINLAARSDRKTHVEEQLSSIGLLSFVKRFNAIKMHNGAIGCSLSHLKCLQYAFAQKWNHVFICEDDITFLDTELFETQFNKCMATLNNQWDVIMFGGNNMPPYKIIDDSCIKITRCATTTGYLVNGHYISKLIDNVAQGIESFLRNQQAKSTFAIDVFWKSLQFNDRWFLITPPIVVQKDGYSDIEQRNTSYTRMMQDLDKTYLKPRPSARTIPTMNLIFPK